MRYLTTLDEYTRNAINAFTNLQKKFYVQISEYLATGKTITPKTLETRVKRAEKIFNDLYTNEFKKDYYKAQGNLFKALFKQNNSDFNIKNDMTSINWQRIDMVRKAGLKFTDNYSDDIIKKLRSRLYIGMMNQENYFTTYEDIKSWLVGANAQARPKIIVRDQMARIAQESIVESYKVNPDKDKYDYYWTGPDDSRTSQICKDRKKGNPYTWEEVEKMSAHPHILCRHRWVAKLKSDSKQKEIKRPNVRSEDYYKFNHVDENVLKDVLKAFDPQKIEPVFSKVINRYSQDLTIKYNKRARGSYYSPGFNKIILRDKKPQTILHETGHYIDDIAAQSLESKRDFDIELIKARDNLKNLENEEIDKIERDLIKLLADEDLAPYKNMGELKRKAIQNIRTPEGKALVEKYNNIVEKAGDIDTGAIQDILDGLSNKNLWTRYGHDIHYWHRNGSDTLTAEVWANLFEITANNKTAQIELFKKHFPEVWEAFNKVLKEIAL